MAGHPQEDAGRGQHAGALQHGDEADREAGHPGQAHHDGGHADHLPRHLPGHQIPRLSPRPRHAMPTPPLPDRMGEGGGEGVFQGASVNFGDSLVPLLLQPS